MTIFDCHLDLAWNALSWNRDLLRPLQEIRAAEESLDDHRSRGLGTVSLPELRRAEMAVCVATLLVRARSEVDAVKRIDLDVRTPEIAWATARGQLSYYRLLQQQGHIRLIADAHSLQDHWDCWCLAARGDGSAENVPTGVILSMEGADPILEPEHVAEWREAGLRVVGLAHYGQGRYAYGTGGAGPLTDAGRELVRELARCSMILDLTHSSDPSFYEALDLFDGPVLASHNNCRALVPGDRQFSDQQIELIIERGGILGAPLDNWMLVPGWVRGESSRQLARLSMVADHIDHVCQLAGNAHHSAIGSDLDGGFGTDQCPPEVDSIADLQKLEQVLRSRGYNDDDISAILHRNWLDFFLRWL